MSTFLPAALTVSRVVLGDLLDHAPNRAKTLAMTEISLFRPYLPRAAYLSVSLGLAFAIGPANPEPDGGMG